MYPLRHKLSMCWWNHDMRTMICLADQSYIIAGGPSFDILLGKEPSPNCGLVCQSELYIYVILFPTMKNIIMVNTKALKYLIHKTVYFNPHSIPVFKIPVHYLLSPFLAYLFTHNSFESYNQSLNHILFPLVH